MAKQKIAPVRGMHDIMPAQMRRHRKVTETARKIAQLYGFEHVATPIVENSEVFKRSLGDSSDVVNKEMYVFPDRKGRELVLRPENTAAIARALISNGLQESLPARFFYNGPMFRYERPQMGRQRQFHQIGVEILGTNNNYLADVDVIACGYQFLKELGLEKRVTLEINTLGDSKSRENYQAALVEYFSKYEKELSADSQVRLKQNPLRILDSKDEADEEIIANSPDLIDYLNEDSQKWFDNVQTALSHIKIYTEKNLNHNLVRGLDYYCHTVFEFTTNELGTQSTILAGGRYDGLVRKLGGHDIDGIGWAAGVERLALMVGDSKAEAPQIALVINNSEIEEENANQLAYHLRAYNIHVDYLYEGSMRKRMHYANNSQAQFALIMKSHEEPFVLKNMETGKEHKLNISTFDKPKGLENIEWLTDFMTGLQEYYGIFDNEPI